jgi:hypothetical protein
VPARCIAIALLAATLVGGGCGGKSEPAQKRRFDVAVRFDTERRVWIATTLACGGQTAAARAQSEAFRRVVDKVRARCPSELTQ